VFARVRSTRAPRPGLARRTDGTFTVDLLEGEEGVAPGQACVLYGGDGRGADVLGGGFIERTAQPADHLALA